MLHHAVGKYAANPARGRREPLLLFLICVRLSFSSMSLLDASQLLLNVHILHALNTPFQLLCSILTVISD
jgi:hypothetical protein